MKNIRGIMLLGLCIFMAILGIGYVAVGGDTKTELTLAPTTHGESAAPAAPSQVPTSGYAVTTEADAATTTESSTEKETTTAEEATTAGSNYAYAYAGFNPTLATINAERWNLLLVNRDYILPDDFSPKLANVSDSSSIQLDSRVVPHYNEMLAAAKADGVSIFSISGYRSVSRQKANFERKINYYETLGYSKAEATQLAAKIVLPPGTSEHNAGLAMDLGTNGNSTLDEAFAKTEAFAWLKENAENYGFILRYDKSKEGVTKIVYEPWHWRYVGVEEAKSINAFGQTLEEYLATQPN